MKQLLTSAILLATCLTGESMASSCADPQVTGSALSNLIAGNTVCATLGDDTWQEQHRGGGLSGDLWDYKKGPTDPIDPSKKVGTWEIVFGRSDVVRYIYGSAGSFTYTVHGSGVIGDPHSFCGGVEIDNAVLHSGATSCP